MRFLIVTNHSYMLWQFRKELIEQLLLDNEVFLSMPFVGHEEDFKKIGCKCIKTEIDRRGINPFQDIKLYRAYKKQLKSIKPDFVITYSIKPNIYMGYACRLSHIRYCVNVQGLGTAFQKKLLSFLAKKMYKAGIKKAKVVFFENKSNYELFKRFRICNNNGVVLNGAGVNLSYYSQQPYPENCGPIKFLFLSRIMKEKGVDELLACIEIIKKEYNDRVAFNFVGPLEEEYKTILDDYTKRGLIQYFGFQSDPRPFYKDAFCLVLPSYHEGLSNVLLEASAIGRPVITSNIPGCLETVDNRKTGLLCNCKDVQSLLESIKYFIELPYDEKKLMGNMARKKVEMEFDKKTIVSKTIDCIFN